MQSTVNFMEQAILHDFHGPNNFEGALSGTPNPASVESAVPRPA
jgi:hypothetical protein